MCAFTDGLLSAWWAGGPTEILRQAAASAGPVALWLLHLQAMPLLWHLPTCAQRSHKARYVGVRVFNRNPSVITELKLYYENGGYLNVYVFVLQAVWDVMHCHAASLTCTTRSQALQEQNVSAWQTSLGVPCNDAWGRWPGVEEAPAEPCARNDDAFCLYSFLNVRVSCHLYDDWFLLFTSTICMVRVFVSYY